jgi:hypothetical protein
MSKLTRDEARDLVMFENDYDDPSNVVDLLMEVQERTARECADVALKARSGYVLTSILNAFSLDAKEQEPEDKLLYPCAKCKRPRKKGKLIAPFPICDECWEIEAEKREEQEPEAGRCRAGAHLFVPGTHPAGVECLHCGRKFIEEQEPSNMDDQAEAFRQARMAEEAAEEPAPVQKCGGCKWYLEYEYECTVSSREWTGDGWEYPYTCKADSCGQWEKK